FRGVGSRFMAAGKPFRGPENKAPLKGVYPSMERGLPGSRRKKGLFRTLPALLSVTALGAVVLARAPDAEGAPSPSSSSAPASSATPDTTTVTPPVVDDVEQMCALLTSCDGLPLPPQFLPHDFAGCVKQMHADMTSASAVNFSLTLRECGLRANSCS